MSLQRTLLDATEHFGRDLATACSYQAEVANLPLMVNKLKIIKLTKLIDSKLLIFLQFLDPIYGTKDPSFTEFMAPGLIIT